MSKKVYVLIPVYNVEKYIKDCFNSLLAQTYTNWEAIVVDDGSKDNSGKICDEYVKKDKRIQVIHQENGGLSMARRTAILTLPDCDDSYCTFLDSDDLLPENALEILIKTAEQENCDIVAGNSLQFSRKIQSYDNTEKILNLKTFNKEQILQELYFGFFGYSSYSVSIWSRLYRTSFFKKIYLTIDSFPFYFGEDLNLTIRLTPEAKKLATIENIVYCYRCNGGTSRFMKTLADDSVFIYKLKKEYSEKYNVSDYYKGLIDVEMKNLAMTYFVMCRRIKTYPHGKFEDEIQYLINIPEFYNAISSIPDETLKNDHSEIQGFTRAFKEKDVETIKKLAVAEANKGKIKRFIKRFM